MAEEAFEPWVRIRYQILKKEFGDGVFTAKEAEKVLWENHKPISNIHELISILVRSKHLISEEREGTKYYRLIEGKYKKSQKTGRDQILRVLKNGADIIRNREYKILLILLFYKALSDKWKKKAEEYYKETKDWKNAYYLTNIDHYVLYDEIEDKLYTWEETIKDKTQLVNNFMIALNKIAELNPKLQDLRILIDKLGFEAFISNEDNYLIFKDLVENFNNLNLESAEQDVLGDAYEWILSYFAPTKAKAGEVYTSREVIRLMVEILDINPNSDVLDPACGSAAMLIGAFKYVSEKYKDGRTLKLEGQEWEDITAILGKLNMVIHGVENYIIYIGDSLVNQKFSEADYVLANPPWNLDYNISKVMNDKLKKIYSYGETPKQSADWLWVQLMHHYARKKVAVVLDNGALFRGGKEKNIRKAFVENDFIEAVILLPDKLFYNTSAPGIILVVNKDKPKDRKGKILFINAENEKEKHPEVRKLNILTRKNIDKIVNTYRNFEDIKGFSRSVSIEEIRKNNYSLNVSLYVQAEEEKEEIDVMKEWKELGKIEKEIEEVERKIEGYLGEVYGYEKVRNIR